MTAKHATGLIWFNLDLRITDNLTLIKAAQECQQLMCCFVIDESWFKGNRYGIQGISQQRWRFIQQSIADLAASLQQYGQQLIIRKGQPTTEISTLISTLGVDAVYSSDDAGVYERRRWQTLTKRFPFIHFERVSNHTLLNEQDLPFSLDNLPSTYSQFRKCFEPLAETLPNGQAQKHLKALPPMPKRSIATEATPFIEPSGYLKGGELAAHQHLSDYFASSAAGSYKETRNALDSFTDSTKFSAALAIGNLSPRQIIDALRDYEQIHGANESTYWIVFELMWREYFYWYLRCYQERVFKFSGIQNKKPVTSFYPQRFAAWCKGKTPYPIVNACMHQLNQTGYMSNRGRQLVASCLIHELQLDWRYGAAYFEQQLLDYDVASNWGNWQYLAGVGADPRGSRRFNLEKQTQTYDPNGEFITRWHGDQAVSQIDFTDAADWPLS